MVGLIVIVIGGLFLLRNLGLIPYLSWSVVWPIIIILIGLCMIEKRRWWNHGHHWHHWKEWNECECNGKKENQNHDE